MRNAYYYQRKKLAGPSALWLKIPYAIRGRAVEAAIARILFAHTGTTAPRARQTL
jgi:hypothetical protein